jgi:hypothetical protein
MARRTFDVIRYLRDLHALAFGPVEERDRGQPGTFAGCRSQVPGRGGGCRDDTGRRGGQSAAVGAAGPGVVPGTGRYQLAAGDAAGDRRAPGLTSWRSSRPGSRPQRHAFERAPARSVALLRMLTVPRLGRPPGARGSGGAVFQLAVLGEVHRSAAAPQPERCEHVRRRPAPPGLAGTHRLTAAVADFWLRWSWVRNAESG